MAYGFIRNSEGIDFSAKNYRKVAFKFDNSLYWMTFFEDGSAYNSRIDACKLGKFYSAESVQFKYCDELQDELIIDVLNNRGFCSLDLYIFRTTSINENGIRIPKYYSDNELFRRRRDPYDDTNN